MEKVMQRAFKKQQDDIEIWNMVTAMTEKLAAEEQQKIMAAFQLDVD